MPVQTRCDCSAGQTSCSISTCFKTSKDKQSEKEPFIQCVAQRVFDWNQYDMRVSIFGPCLVLNQRHKPGMFGIHMDT